MTTWPRSSACCARATPSPGSTRCCRLKIAEFDDAQVAKVTSLLDAFGKTHADVLAFALTLVAKRLKSSWQLIRLATKAAPSKNAADIAAAPYAIAVSMVLDRLDDRRSTLRVALKNDRVLVAKEILTEIYDTEYALRVRIDSARRIRLGKAAQSPDRRDRSSRRSGGEPVSRECRPRAGIEPPAQLSISCRTPDLSGVEGTRCPGRRRGLLQETGQPGLKSAELRNRRTVPSRGATSARCAAGSETSREIVPRPRTSATNMLSAAFSSARSSMLGVSPAASSVAPNGTITYDVLHTWPNKRRRDPGSKG